MPELLLHYIWQSRLFLQLPQQTTDGRRVEVLDVGKHNTDAGPDFFAATIRIDGVTWTGNVEIHVCASDWYRHGHHADPAYDNVILHVVKRADKQVFNSKGDALDQCELSYPYEPEYLARMLTDMNVLCEQKIHENPSYVSAWWLDRLLNRRMQQKSDAVKQLLALSHNNYEEAFYITLAHNFGFHTNGLPFELLAKQTPLPYLMKHRNSLFQLEAMLLGQSGLLNEETAEDDYSRSLLKEYLFLKKKFSLVPLEAHVWKMLRMRPQSFPHLRIAQFAALLQSKEMLLRVCLDTSDLSQLRRVFDVNVSEYWRTHYRFGSDTEKEQRSGIAAEDGCVPLSKKQGEKTKEETKNNIGKSAIDVLIINTVVPYKFAWGTTHSNLMMQEEAFTILNQIPAENNNIIRRWRMLGVKVGNASQSQALLQLYQEYCVRKRCADCNIGYNIFTPES